MVTPGVKFFRRNICVDVMTINRLSIILNFRLRIILWDSSHNAPLSGVRYDFSDVNYMARIKLFLRAALMAS